MRHTMVLLCILILFCACKSGKKTNQAVKSPNKSALVEPSEPSSDKLISLEKGACHGFCPIYKMTIYKSGKVHYNGIRFVDKLGPFTNRLSSEELEHFSSLIKSLDWTSYPDKIPSMIADLPSTTLTNHLLTKEKKVWWNRGAPDELNLLAEELSALLKKSNWKIDKNAPLPKNVISNELIVELEPNIDENAFLKNYINYDLKVKERLVPKMPIWLLEYDQTKIQAYEILNLLNNSDSVKNVEFNKSLNPRQ